ncbi:MAG: MFS transporter [Candidatus Nezhaarchaeota archaeon]|nr:MFS transporter [Candidatus Nezhaarchaeota archaeon]
MATSKSPTRVLLVATASHLMQHAFIGTSVLFPLIIEELRLTYVEFGLAISASTLIGGLSQVLFGAASRRVARNVLLGLGNFLLALGVFLAGLARRLTDFLAARLVSSIGTAPHHPVGTAIVSESFSEKSLGRALGFYYGLAYVGNAAGPALMTVMAATLGWRATLIAFSIPIFATSFLVLRYLSEVGGREAEGGAKELSLRSSVAALLRTRGVSAILATQVLLSGGAEVGVLTTYVPVFLADFLKMDVYERGLAYTVGLLGGAIGPIVVGGRTARVGYVKPSAIVALLAAMLTYLLVLYEPGSMVLLVAAHLFALMFTGFSLPVLLQSQLVKLTSGYDRDLVVGLFFTIGFVFSSLWIALIGFVVDAHASFKPALVIIGALTALALMPLSLSRVADRARGPS